MPVRFHLLGDVGQTTNSQNSFQEILDQELNAEGVMSGGIVNMGDLSYANGNEPLWDRFE